MSDARRARSLLLAGALLAGGAGVALAADADMPAYLEGKLTRQQYLELRAQYISRLRGMPHGLPYDPRARAILRMEEQERLEKVAAPASGPPSWTPLGPAPIPGGALGVSEPFSGRVTAIAVHPTDPDKVYVGTAGGGLYRSLDGGETWTPLMDQALSLAIGAIAIAPSDPTQVWVGTGEGNDGWDTFVGVGVYRIENAESASPVLDGPFTLDPDGHDVFTATAITKLVVHPTDPETLFVATSFGRRGFSGTFVYPPRPVGLYRSRNASAASPRFQRLSGTPAGAAVTDVALLPGNPDRLLCAVTPFYSGAERAGVYRTLDANASTPTFEHTLTFDDPFVQGRFAISGAADKAVVMLATGETPKADCGSPLRGVLRVSTDFGATFGTPLPAANGFCGYQCNYDIAVAAAPADRYKLYLGGQADFGGCASAALTRSIDAGATFVRSEAGLHADTHAIAVAPSLPSVVFLGSDGGIFKSNDAGATWRSLNNGDFSATQFIGFAQHPSDRGFLVGGTQDNGTLLRRADLTWSQVNGGDGGKMLIDQNATGTVDVDVYAAGGSVGSIIAIARAETFECGANYWAYRGCGLTPSPYYICHGVTPAAANGIACSDSAVLFFPPIALGPGTPNTLYLGTDRLYRSSDRGDTMVAVSQQLVTPSSTQIPVAVSAIAIAPSDDRIRLVGLANGKVFLSTTGSSPMIDVTGSMPPNYVGHISIDPSDPNIAYATLDGFGLADGKHVLKCSDLLSGAPHWAVSGVGIPDVPVNAFAIDSTATRNLYAGTEIGVYASHDAGLTWTPFNRGLPRVPVFEMAFQAATHLLRIATHGRGVWEIDANRAAPCLAAGATLCLDDEAGDARFEVTGSFATTQGAELAGDAQTVSLAALGVDHGGLLWFFSPDNPESLIKVLNGCAVNGKYWVFYAAGTNVGFTLTVRDTQSGVSKVYTHADRSPAIPRQDTAAFACTTSEIARAARRPPPGAVTREPARAAVNGSCIPGPTALCIADRFRITVDYKTAQSGGHSGPAQAIALDGLGVARGGLFSFFGKDNPEMLVKVLDGCALGGKQWIFSAADTNVGFTLTVKDTKTGYSKVYTNSDLTAAPPIQDTAALPCQ